MNKEQKSDYNSRMERAGAFEDMSNHKGFEYIKTYYTNSIQTLANRILQEGETLDGVEESRQRVIGIKRLLSFIESDIEFLNNERKNTESTTTTS